MLKSKPNLIFRQKSRNLARRQGVKLRNYTSQTGRVESTPFRRCKTFDNNSYRVSPPCRRSLLSRCSSFFPPCERNEGEKEAEAAAFLSTLLVRENNQRFKRLSLSLSSFLSSLSLHLLSALFPTSNQRLYLSTSRGFSFQFRALRCFPRTTGFPFVSFYFSLSAYFDYYSLFIYIYILLIFWSFWLLIFLILYIIDLYIIDLSIRFGWPKHYQINDYHRDYWLLKNQHHD